MLCIVPSWVIKLSLCSEVFSRRGWSLLKLRKLWYGQQMCNSCWWPTQSCWKVYSVAALGGEYVSKVCMVWTCKEIPYISPTTRIHCNRGLVTLTGVFVSCFGSPVIQPQRCWNIHIGFSIATWCFITWKSNIEFPRSCPFISSREWSIRINTIQQSTRLGKFFRLWFDCRVNHDSFWSFLWQTYKPWMVCSLSLYIDINCVQHGSPSTVVYLVLSMKILLVCSIGYPQRCLLALHSLPKGILGRLLQMIIETFVRGPIPGL